MPHLSCPTETSRLTIAFAGGCASRVRLIATNCGTLQCGRGMKGNEVAFHFVSHLPPLFHRGSSTRMLAEDSYSAEENFDRISNETFALGSIKIDSFPGTKCHRDSIRSSAHRDD